MCTFVHVCVRQLCEKLRNSLTSTSKNYNYEVNTFFKPEFRKKRLKIKLCMFGLN